MEEERSRVDQTVTTPLGNTERRTHETIIVQRGSNGAWWAVGGLAVLVLLGILWFATRPADTTEADMRVAQAEAAAEAARQNADTAIMQNQLSATRDSVAIANAETATARADALRADAEARAAEARAATPVIVERSAPQPAPANGAPVVTSTTPQPGN